MSVPSDPIEARRLRLQATLDSSRGLSARNRRGQFATPPALARQLVRLGLAHLSEPTLHFLDPAVGTGSLYSALRACARRPVETALGVERDTGLLAAARALWEREPLELRSGDFTALPPERRFNLVVANPPYVRHHHLDPDEKARLVARSSALLRERVSGLSGLYVHFMVHAWPWMKPDGIGAWLVPSEFMDTAYGQAIRRWLCSKVTLLRLHRFDPAHPAFDDALVSSAVLLLQNRPPALNHRARFTFGGSLDTPLLEASLPVAALRDHPKWTRFPHEPLHELPTDDAPRLGALFQVQRGLATGANRYFILDEARARALGLPPFALVPILPSPRALPTDTVEADGKGMPVGIPRRYLLDCRLSPDEARAHPALWEYLQSGEGTISTGYLCSRRTPWYAQERRSPAPILCTYMGRSQPGRPPFRFLRNRSQALAGNGYLALTPRRTLSAEALDGVWRHLRSLDPATLTREGRVYGGGLHKLEPRELMALPLPTDLQVFL